MHLAGVILRVGKGRSVRNRSLAANTTILFCPRCGQRYREARQPRTRFNISLPLTRSACAQSFTVDELRTESGQTIPEYLAQAGPFTANDPSTDPRTTRLMRYTLPVALMAGLALLGLAWFLAL